jgi:hypothetical protein
MSSMNSTLRTADRATHIRIVVVALVAAVVVVTVGLNARTPDTDAVTVTKARVDGPVQKAGRPAIYSHRDGTAVR